MVENRFIYHFLKLNQEKMMTKQHGAGIPALRTNEILTLKSQSHPIRPKSNRADFGHIYRADRTADRTADRRA